MDRFDGEQGAAKQSEIGQGVGLTSARAVFTPQRVSAPVVAVFDASPMAADQVLPMRRSIVGGRNAGEIEARFCACLTIAFHHARAAHDDQRARKGEIDLERFDWEGVDLPGFDSTVAGVGLRKKGGVLASSS